MDDNTAKVLMAIIALIGTVVTPIVVVYVNNRTNKKVDAYHKEVNGKMGELLETTKKLGKEEGKAEEKAKKQK